MNLKKVLKEIDLELSEEEMRYLKSETKKFIEVLKSGIIKTKVDADVFVGGSFAKGTLSKSEEYDVDVFVRFDWKEGVHLSDLLEKVLQRSGLKFERWHGSRDYFKISKDKKLTFEVIPVLKIEKPIRADNVMDLSYFHVNYVKRNLPVSGRRDVRLAKQFCKAARVYGAESYVKGFSGYALECLIINYGSFEKMLKALVKIRERIILDPGKKFKKKGDIVFSLNESKIAGPIVLVDPTFLKRNVLAGLSWETFKKFQFRVEKFLKKPNRKFFEIQQINVSKLKKKGEFIHVLLETDRQEGDIAGTKMKKFSRFLIGEVGKYFNVLEEEFNYSGGKSADFYLVGRKKREVIKIGPPLSRKEDVKSFKRKNKKTFVKNGIVHSIIKVDFSLKEFLLCFKKNFSGKVEEMGINKMRID